MLKWLWVQLGLIITFKLLDKNNSSHKSNFGSFAVVAKKFKSYLLYFFLVVIVTYFRNKRDSKFNIEVNIFPALICFFPFICQRFIVIITKKYIYKTTPFVKNGIVNRCLFFLYMHLNICTIVLLQFVYTYVFTN